jgi:hypothetical protein
VYCVTKRRTGYFFEHGSGRFDSSRIGHAHIHALPTDHTGLLQALTATFTGHEIESMFDVGRLASKHRSYIFLETSKGARWFFDASENDGKRLHLRQILAKSMHMPTRWDWATYPGAQTIQRTIDILSKA